MLTALHFVLCYDKKLRLHASGGQREREWQFDAAVRYAKVLGGAAGREGLVIGLEDGQVRRRPPCCLHSASTSTTSTATTCTTSTSTTTTSTTTTATTAATTTARSRSKYPYP